MIPLADPARFAIQMKHELHTVLDRLLDKRVFVLGEMVNEFESQYANYLGIKHCISVASGTDAIEIAMRVLECEGKEVVLVANAGGYGTISCLAIGATPVYADIDPHSLLVSVQSIVNLVTPNTGAIVVTHLFGLVMDCALINAEVTKKIGKSIPLIEDCAQAHGGIINGKRAGTQNTIGCFSFYPTKNLGALGDGGALVTNDDSLALKIQYLRQYGWIERYMQSDKGGRNSRLDEIQAGFLTKFLPQLDFRNDLRRRIVKRYFESGALMVHGDYVDSDQYVAHLAVCLVNDRDSLQEKMRADGVHTGIHYPYLDTEFPTTSHLGVQLNLLTNSHSARQRILTLPCFPDMQLEEIDMVCRSIVKHASHFEAIQL